MDRIIELAKKLNDMSMELDPYDYEGTIMDHLDMLMNDPLDVIDQLIDIVNELLV